MRFLAFSILAILLLSVESALVKTFNLDVVRIDVTVALITYLALRSTTLEGAFTAFACGYLLDVFTGRPAGLYPFLGVLTFLLVRGVGQLLDGRSRASYTLFVGAATGGHALLAYLFTLLTARSGSTSFLGVVLQVPLTAAVGALLWPLLRKIEPGEHSEPAGLR